MAENVSGETLKEAAETGSKPTNCAKTKLLVIDPNTKDFMANGKHYFVENQISFARWNKYQKLQVELGYSMTFEQLFNKLNEAYAMLNKMQFADSAVCIRDIMKGVIDIQKKESPSALKLCALFINEENEDRRDITDDQISHKVADWEAEGIEMGSFFQLALSIIPGFLQTYKILSPDTLK